MKTLSIALGMMLVLLMAGPSWAIQFTVEPADPSVVEGETVALEIYLDDWTEDDNVAGVDYYFTYDNVAASIVSVTPNSGPDNGWDDSYFWDATPVPGSAYCGVVNYGAGVAGPKMLLQTVILTCDDGNTDFDFVVTLGGDLIVLDVPGNEYTDVTDGVSEIDQSGQPECDDNSDCDDSNVCTDDTCVGGTCQYVNNSNFCDDGLFCTDVDQCVGGVCVAGPARDCSAAGDPCNDGVCDDVLDQCVAQPVADGTGCDDGLFCTQDDTCQGGVCTGGSSSPCTPDQTCDEINDTCVDNVNTSSSSSSSSSTSTSTASSSSPSSSPSSSTSSSSSSSSSSTSSVVTTSTTTVPAPPPTTTVIPSSTTTTAGTLCPFIDIYGEDSAEVQQLRFIRDAVLSKTPEGREIISLYYEWSPLLQSAIANDEVFKRKVRSMIDAFLSTVGLKVM